MWGMVIMIYSAEEEAKILDTKMINFRTRRLLKDFLSYYEIEYDKRKLNKVDIHAIKTIGELLCHI